MAQETNEIAQDKLKIEQDVQDNGRVANLGIPKVASRLPKEPDEFTPIYKTDDVTEMANKILYKFKIGQSCTINGIVISDKGVYRNVCQNDILADVDMVKKGDVVLSMVKTKQKSQSKDFGFKAGEDTRVSIWRKR
jgi:hypothetical protein